MIESRFSLRMQIQGALEEADGLENTWLSMGALSLYGMRATYPGRFGTLIGRGPIFMILTATLAGIFSGEWRFAPRWARTLLVMSIICLSGATAILANANR